ncbi:hypothetical protein KKG80_00220, partial [Patescibacteria group bacterium]|nr:hypothetical protein [Patescibacteria group bacterium]
LYLLFMKKKDQLIKQKLIKQSIYFCLAILITLGISVSAQSLFAMWVNPDKIPPDGNLPAPINVSDVAQYKLGNLGIGSIIPNSLLHLYKTIGNNAEIDIQSVEGSGNHWGIYQDRDDNNDLKFWQGDDRMIITKNGNLNVVAIPEDSQKLNWGGLEICQFGFCCPPWKDCDEDGKTYEAQTDCDEKCPSCYKGAPVGNGSDGKDHNCDGTVDDIVP